MINSTSAEFGVGLSEMGKPNMVRGVVAQSPEQIVGGCDILRFAYTKTDSVITLRLLLFQI